MYLCSLIWALESNPFHLCIWRVSKSYSISFKKSESKKRASEGKHDTMIFWNFSIIKNYKKNIKFYIFVGSPYGNLGPTKETNYQNQNKSFMITSVRHIPLKVLLQSFMKMKRFMHLSHLYAFVFHELHLSHLYASTLFWNSLISPHSGLRSHFFGI